MKKSNLQSVERPRSVGRENIGRRRFIGLMSTCFAAFASFLTGCRGAADNASNTSPDESAAKESTASDSADAAVSAGSTLSFDGASPDPDSEFGVDENVNMRTIDDYLSVPGAVFRDMRMVIDPARYDEIGGNSELSIYLEGFRVVPFPYIGTLAPLPVSGAYAGPCLFEITWGDGLDIVSASPNYTQSMQILEELFPKDEPIVLACGGGGYAAMMKALLIYLGWDFSMLYNAGGIWDYEGHKPTQLVSYADPDVSEYYLWRADIVYFDFDLLQKL